MCLIIKEKQIQLFFVCLFIALFLNYITRTVRETFEDDIFLFLSSNLIIFFSLLFNIYINISVKINHKYCVIISRKL